MQATINNIRRTFGNYREQRKLRDAMVQNRLARKFALDQQEAYRMQAIQLDAEFALLQNRVNSL